MKFEVNFREIFYLSILFTILALIFDIYNENHVLSFIISHITALLIALIISKLIHTMLIRFK